MSEQSDLPPQPPDDSPDLPEMAPQDLPDDPEPDPVDDMQTPDAPADYIQPNDDEEGPQYAGFGNGDEPDTAEFEVPGDEGDTQSQFEDLQAQIDELRSMVRLPDILPSLFPARIGTSGTWQELNVVSGSLIDFLGGRNCSSSSHPSTPIIANSTAGTAAFLLEVPDDPNNRYLQIVGGSGGTLAGLITGNASGSGKYTGKSFADITSNVSASGALAEADCGTLATSNDCLVLNLIELGSTNTGHDLTATANVTQFSLYFVGRLLRVNSDGTKVIEIDRTYAGC